MDVAYRAVAAYASELVARHAADSTMLYVSVAARSVLGEDAAFLLGKPLLSLIARADHPLYHAAVAKLRTAKEPQQCRVRLSSERGGHTLNVRICPLPDAEATASSEYVTFTQRDHEQAGEGRWNLAALGKLLDSLPGMIYQWRVAPNGTRQYLYVNEWPRRVLGIDTTDLTKIDEQLTAMTQPEDARTAWESLERALARLEHWYWRGRMSPRPGELVHVVGHSIPEKQADGTILWSGVLLDESPRRRTEEALEQTEGLFRAVVTNMAMAHLRFDLEGKIVLVNPAGLRMLGYESPDQLLGKNAAQKLWLSRSRFQATLAKVMADGIAVVEAPLRARRGGRRTVQGALRLLRDANGQPVGIDGVLRDITEELAAREELVHARDAAEAGSRAKSAFLANMSHEIRTPMNAIIGLSHLALESDPPAKQRDYLTQIHAAAIALLDILNDVLDVSKIEAGKLTLAEEVFELDRLLDSVANIVSVRAAEKNLEVALWVDPDVPEELLGDRLRLGQVLTNLASNAVKFTERGEIVISVRRLASDANHARLRFSVRDTGIGMTREQTARLFQPFSQGDNSTTRKYGGTGLGLSISQELVHLMGGQIDVESTPGKGSEFHFDVTLGVRSASEGARKTPRDVRGLRVLVVDDSEIARDVMTRSLNALGFEVASAGSGDEGLATLTAAQQRGEPFQVALIDARMPAMDGPALAAAIDRSNLALKPIVIMVSAHTRDEIYAGRELETVRAFLRKPVSRSTLLDTILETTHASPDVPPVEAKAVERKRPLEGYALLVVEDNEINQVLARDLLEAAGATVALASDGRQAIQLAASAAPPFDLILMDVQMPGMDGHATTRILRRQPETRDTPIVAMTAHAFDAERKKCLESGMNAHVAKPINPPELVQTVLTWVRSRERPARVENGTREAFDPNALAAVFRERDKQIAFLRKFVESARGTLNELGDAWERRSFEQIGFIGHKLKSSAKACGAHQLAAACLDLERFARERDWSSLSPLRGEAERLLAEVATHVGELEHKTESAPSPPK